MGGFYLYLDCELCTIAAYGCDVNSAQSSAANDQAPPDLTPLIARPQSVLTALATTRCPMIASVLEAITQDTQRKLINCSTQSFGFKCSAGAAASAAGI